MDQTSNRPPNIEEKLTAILKIIRGEGRNVADSARRLADKVSGSVPSENSCCAPEQKPVETYLMSVVDDIGRELQMAINDTALALDRAHRGVGDFGHDKMLAPARPMTDVTYAGNGRY